MPAWLQAVIASVASILASSGFWAFLQSKNKRRAATTRLLMGLAYDKIVQLGMSYIDRGSITKDEFEEINKYLFEPYKDLGGNGVAARVMEAVSKLPLKSYGPYMAKSGSSKERKNENE